MLLQRILLESLNDMHTTCVYSYEMSVTQMANDLRLLQIIFPPSQDSTHAGLDHGQAH